MSKPKLSVVMPVYNEKDTLEEIIRRVKSVEIGKEIIIVDDFSTDGSRDILKELEKDPIISVFYQEVNKGKGAALAIWDIGHPRELAYWTGTPQLAELVIGGHTSRS